MATVWEQDVAAPQLPDPLLVILNVGMAGLKVSLTSC